MAKSTRKAPKAAGKTKRTDIRRMKVMVSSRCNDLFPRVGGKPLSGARRELKKRLEEARLFDQQLFQAWINEDAPGAAGDSGWEACMKQVDDCDVLLVLYNGNAGWTKSGSGVGICHGELQRAIEMAPGKVRLIRLGTDADIGAPTGAVNDRFRAYVGRFDLFAGLADSVESLLDIAEQTVLHAFADLVGWGVREARKGKYYMGDALEWSKLDYPHRQARIKEVLRDALVTNGGTALGDSHVKTTIDGTDVLWALSAVPASLSIAAAREMIGRPFLKDHELVGAMGGAVGPVHMIGCNRATTESQALQLLGFPDATVVNAPFGIYVADDVQKVQFVLLGNCRDDTTTRQALQRFQQWMDEVGQASDLLRRAVSRRRIVAAIAEEASA